MKETKTYIIGPFRFPSKHKIELRLKQLLHSEYSTDEEQEFLVGAFSLLPYYEGRKITFVKSLERGYNALGYAARSRVFHVFFDDDDEQTPSYKDILAYIPDPIISQNQMDRAKVMLNPTDDRSLKEIIKERTLTKLDRLIEYTASTKTKAYLESLKQQFLERGYLSPAQTKAFQNIGNEVDAFIKFHIKQEDEKEEQIRLREKYRQYKAKKAQEATI